MECLPVAVAIEALSVISLPVDFAHSLRSIAQSHCWLIRLRPKTPEVVSVAFESPAVSFLFDLPGPSDDYIRR